MGIVHHTATLSPTKQELVEAWLPEPAVGRGTTGRRQGRGIPPRRRGGRGRRRDHPLAYHDGTVEQTAADLPLRPVDGAEAHLVGTTDHSVLGTRWVYDGCADPVWASTLVAAILTGGRQSQMFIEQDGQRVDVPPRMQVRGSGSDGSAPQVTSIDSVADDGATTVVTAADLELAVARVVGTPLGEGPHLSGTVGDSDETTVLAVLRRH